MLREQRLLVEGLTVTSSYLSDHVSNYVPVHGDLSADQADMLATLDEALHKVKNDDTFREKLEKMQHNRSL